MLRQRKFQKFVVIGLASAMIVPAGAAARPMDNQVPSAAPAAAVQDHRAPDQVAPASQPGKTANVLVPPVPSATSPNHPETANVLVPPVPSATSPNHPANPAPTWPAHPQTLTPPAASSDDGIDTGWFVGLGGLALVAIMGTGSFFLIRARSLKRAAA